MTNPASRPWWIAGTLILTAQRLALPALMVVLLLIGLTPLTLTAAAAGLVAVLSASAVRRWATWRALAEIPGAFWTVTDASVPAPVKHALSIVRVVGDFAVVTAYIHIAATLNHSPTPPLEDPRGITWWLLTPALAAGATRALIRTKGTSATAWTFALAMVVGALAYPRAVPTIAAAVFIGTIAALIWTYLLHPTRNRTCKAPV